MKKLTIISLCILLACSLFVGCKNDEDKKDASALKGVTEESPLKVDKDGKTVTIYSTFNGKFEFEPTRHLAIYSGGKIADMALFKSFVSPEDFSKALEEVGGEAGNNMTAENAATTLSEGSSFKVTLYWEGNEDGIDLNDFLKDSNGKDLDIKFSGNMDASKEFNTGCITCLDSCFVGITSNATYPLGAIEETKEVAFEVNHDKCPDDKQAVAIVYTLK